MPFPSQREIKRLWYPVYSLQDVLPMMKGMEFPIGVDREGNFRKADLSEMDHILISGGSGFGKSIFIDSMILSLIAHNGPEKIQFVMCDTKASEFSRYVNMDYLLMPIATSAREISALLGLVISQGKERLKAFADNKVKTISSFNDIAWENYERELPRIVVIVDDLSTIVNPIDSTRMASYMADRVEQFFSIGRSAGIHLVAATQTPVKKKTKEVSSRFLSKITFYSPSRADMRFLMGEKIQGPKPEPGEAVFFHKGNYEEVHTILPRKDDFLLLESRPDPDLIDRAAEIAIEDRTIDTEKIQSRFGIGRNQAANILSTLEEIGLISAPDASGIRTALISKEQWEQAMEQLDEE